MSRPHSPPGPVRGLTLPCGGRLGHTNCRHVPRTRSPVSLRCTFFSSSRLHFLTVLALFLATALVSFLYFTFTFTLRIPVAFQTHFLTPTLLCHVVLMLLRSFFVLCFPQQAYDCQCKKDCLCKIVDDKASSFLETESSITQSCTSIKTKQRIISKQCVLYTIR